MESLLHAQDLELDDIYRFICHPGGVKVIGIGPGRGRVTAQPSLELRNLLRLSVKEIG